ncbi:MAG TPA: ATP-binding protein [Geobacteraceae bacterium]|nr:ATP-binding protein [Geobacteraceae bacterium]
MLTLDQLTDIITRGERLDVEFKSDRRILSDREIYEEVVSLANSKGGVILIGVEDAGTVSGAHPRHGNVTDPPKLQSAIFNNTVPSINTRISVITYNQVQVIAIEVDPYPEPCATKSGKALHRTIKSDGKPESVPFYPRDQRSRRVDLGLLDFSAHVLEQLTFADLDPLEFERLRQEIVRLRGDRSLLDLSNEEIAKALRLVESRHGRLVPNVAGLLLLGRENVIADIIPTHQVHFQVIDAQANVKVNDPFRAPLLKTLQEIESRFAARNEEKEVTIGMLRLPVPDYSPSGFREAVNNAVLHRDYTRLDDVYIQMHQDHLLITSPGGFPEGVTIDNILVHEPKPRNPRLASAFKRIGLVEQTGRGVDRIFEGQLRYGRPAPDYTRSDTSGVRVILNGGEPSLKFASFVYEEDKAGRPFLLDELIVLNTLFIERRIDSDQVAKVIQKGSSEGKRILERLLERGLIEARGEKRARVYHLAAALYNRLEDVSGYVRTKGFDKIQQHQMVLSALVAGKDKRITREDVAELCKITPAQAYHLLKKMTKNNEIELHGSGRGSYYTLKTHD